jgi:transposase
VERFCRDALAEHARLFRLWHKFRSGQIDRNQTGATFDPRSKSGFSSWPSGIWAVATARSATLPRFCSSTTSDYLLFSITRAWSPLTTAASEPSAQGVQWRKICFGNRSAKGELATARLLTVAETCGLQRLNVLAYLSATITCHRSRSRIYTTGPGSRNLHSNLALPAI